MSSIYGGYQRLITCYPGDEVFVFNANESCDLLTQEKLMIGKICSIKQWIHEDWLGDVYLYYDVSIIMPDNKNIKVRDEFRKIYFRKFEFITKSDYIKLIKNKR